MSCSDTATSAVFTAVQVAQVKAVPASFLRRPASRCRVGCAQTRTGTCRRRDLPVGLLLDSAIRCIGGCAMRAAVLILTAVSGLLLVACTRLPTAPATTVGSTSPRVAANPPGR